ncbi:TPA: type III secretion protein [Proteus mirabilis]
MNISNVRYELNQYKDKVDKTSENETIVYESKLNKEFEPIVKEFVERVKDNIKPILSKPEINSLDLKKILKELDVDNDSDIYDNIKTENLGAFNIISEDIMKLINLIVKYSEALIKKYEASREMGVMLMNIELNLAEQMKDNLNKKANIMIGAAITSAGLSMAINGIGAFVSIKGIGKNKDMGEDKVGHSNPTIIKGNLISSTADPLARVADQTLQSQGIKIDGEQKVLEARASINSHVVNNNNDIQREITEVVKALLQAIEGIIHAQQDAASSIGANVRG